jgi:hypothetical protein
MTDQAGKKKIILVAVCLGLAGVIAAFQFRGGGSRSRDNEPLWMKCTNPQCNAEFTITARQYFDFSQQHLTPAGNPISPMAMDRNNAYQCPHCNRPNALKAIKCGQCEHVFIEGAAGRGQLPDTCPECGYNPFRTQ